MHPAPDTLSPEDAALLFLLKHSSVDRLLELLDERHPSQAVLDAALDYQWEAENAQCVKVLLQDGRADATRPMTMDAHLFTKNQDLLMVLMDDPRTHLNGDLLWHAAGYGVNSGHLRILLQGLHKPGAPPVEDHELQPLIRSCPDLAWDGLLGPEATLAALVSGPSFERKARRWIDAANFLERAAGPGEIDWLRLLLAAVKAHNVHGVEWVLRHGSAHLDSEDVETAIGAARAAFESRLPTSSYEIAVLRTLLGSTGAWVGADADLAYNEPPGFLYRLESFVSSDDRDLAYLEPLVRQRAIMDNAFQTFVRALRAAVSCPREDTRLVAAILSASFPLGLGDVISTRHIPPADYFEALLPANPSQYTTTSFDGKYIELLEVLVTACDNTAMVDFLLDAMPWLAAGFQANPVDHPLSIVIQTSAASLNPDTVYHICMVRPDTRLSIEAAGRPLRSSSPFDDEGPERRRTTLLSLFCGSESLRHVKLMVQAGVDVNGGNGASLKHALRTQQKDFTQFPVGSCARYLLGLDTLVIGATAFSPQSYFWDFVTEGETGGRGRGGADGRVIVSVSADSIAAAIAAHPTFVPTPVDLRAAATCNFGDAVQTMLARDPALRASSAFTPRTSFMYSIAVASGGRLPMKFDDFFPWSVTSHDPTTLVRDYPLLRQVAANTTDQTATLLFQGKMLLNRAAASDVSIEAFQYLLNSDARTDTSGILQTLVTGGENLELRTAWLPKRRRVLLAALTSPKVTRHDKEEALRLLVSSMRSMRNPRLTVATVMAMDLDEDLISEQGILAEALMSEGAVKQMLLQMLVRDLRFSESRRTWTQAAVHFARKRHSLL